MASIQHKIIPIRQLPSHLDLKSSDVTLFFRLPKFQRGIVWDRDRKLGLIDSVINGYPMGSILLYSSQFAGTKQEVDVVDGLQRATTLTQFVQKPLEFLRPSQVFSESFLNELDQEIDPNANRSDPEYKRKSDTVLIDWLNEIGSVTSPDFKASKLGTYLGEHFEKFQGSVPLELFGKLESGLHEATQVVTRLFDYELPAVLYSGPQETVPEIFERINSLGKKLDKYEVLASTWANEKVLILNKGVRKKLEERYQGWLDMGWDVENYDPAKGIGVGDANLHEYLLGLSQVLAESYPSLYKFQKDSEDSTIAFVLATYAFGLRNSEMALLPRVMQRTSGSIDPSAFEKALFEVSDSIETSLAALKLRLNKTSDNSLVLHSQNQIVSMAAALLVSCYEFGAWKLVSKNLRDKISKALPSHYIRDILDGAWSGSGDSRAYRLVWDETSIQQTGTGHRKASSHYHTPVSRQDFNKVFDNWNIDQLRKSQTDRPNTSKEAKVVLLLAYSSVVSFQSNAQITFELEHLYPVKHIKGKIAGSGIGWPISAIGNLALLDKKHNRIKGEKLLGDYLPTLLAKKKNPIEQTEVDLINKYVIYPDYTQIVDDPSFDLLHFKDFCTKRAEVIRDLIAQNTHMP